MLTIAYIQPKKTTRAQMVRQLAKIFVDRHQNRNHPTKDHFKQLKNVKQLPEMRTPA